MTIWIKLGSLVVRSESTEKIEMICLDWLSLPLAMKRSTLRRAVKVLRHNLRDINFEHIEMARLVVEKGDVGAKATLPQGLMLTVSYHTFIIAAENAPIFAPALINRNSSKIKPYR